LGCLAWMRRRTKIAHGSKPLTDLAPVLPNDKREVRVKTFELQFRYRDRNEETVESTVRADASSLPGAVAKATREFVKSLDRKQRFDMNKNGLEITAKSAGTAVAGQGETEAAAG